MTRYPCLASAAGEPCDPGCECGGGKYGDGTSAVQLLEDLVPTFESLARALDAGDYLKRGRS